MLNKIKSNKFLRKSLFKILSNYYTSRKYPNSGKRLYFRAGKNLNLFFSKNALIEPVITKKIINFVKGNHCIFDIGANIGYYTVLFSANAADAKIVAVEPDGDNIAHLVKNIELNKLNNVEIVGSAISSGKGKSKFYIDVNTGRTSSIEKNVWHPPAANIQESEVDTITLDDLSLKYGSPDLIKCDVEGHELEILKGSGNTLSQKPVWFLEVRDYNFKKVFEILSSFGYLLFNSEAKEKEPVDSHSNPIPNLICIPKEKYNVLSGYLNL